MEIILLQPGDKSFHLFESVPLQLYPPGSIRHTQEDTINQEFLCCCLLAMENNRVMGRLAVYNNPHLHYRNIKTACIGNYECRENDEAASALLSRAREESKGEGAGFLTGPMNGSTWDSYRFSASPDNPPFLLESCHHLYYNEQFMKNGFHALAGYHSFITRQLVCDRETVLKREAELLEEGIHIRTIDMNCYEEELRKLYPFISSAFSLNFLYTPITWETFRNKYLEASAIINPEYVLIAEDRQGKIIGFIFCYDDLCNTLEKRLVIKTIARHADPHWTGLGHVLANRVIRLIRDRGYQSFIHAFIKDEGTSSEISRNFTGEPYRQYTLYGTAL